MDRARVLIALADTEARASVRSRLVQHSDDVEVVGFASSADEALFLTGTASPTVLIADVSIPDSGGFDLARNVRQQYPMIGVVLLTAEVRDEDLFAAVRYGAAAYVSLDAQADELRDLVVRVHEGTYVIDDHVLANPDLALRVLTAFRELTALEERVKPLFAPLSPRELEVLEHAARGATNRNIARDMGISEQTVKNHLGSIMRKLAVNDRTQAVVYALQHGWIDMRNL